MKFSNFWLNKTIIKEIKASYDIQNVKKLEEFKSSNYDIIKILDLENHPLIDSIKKNKIKNLIFFLNNYISEDLLEEAFIISKQQKLYEIEKILVLFCKSKKERYSHFAANYRKSKKAETFNKKYN